MNKITGDSASEKLSMLLDGELSPEQEVPLFSELTLNDELRSEMRDLLSIKNAVRSDSEAFVPSLAATTAVFQKAGYALPGVYYTGLKSFLIKYSWIPLLIAALTGFTTFSIMKNNHDMEIAGLNSDMSKIKNTLLAYQSEIDKLTAENAKLQIAASKPPQIREVIKYVKVPVVSAREVATAQNDSPADDKQNKLMAENDASNNSLSMLSMTLADEGNYANNMNADLQLNNRTDGQLEYIPSNTIYSPLSTNMGTNNKEYYLRFGGISGITYPSVNVDSPAELSNLIFGLYFLTPYEDTYIGVEGGREPFSQQFYNVDPDGHKYLYEQRPNIWWGGAGMVAEFGDKINALFGARPYAKLFLGASELGPLGKISTGFNWKSSAWGLGAFLGVEGSMLGYQNQGAWYTSQKLGLTYGMSIQF
jgi:hypothetical protein